MLQNIANILQILIAAGVAYFVGFTFALVIWTFRDIQSRSQDVVVQILATLWVAVMNLPGLLIYLILRPSHTLVEAYEKQYFPMDLPDAVEAIKFRMEQSGLSAKDLVPMIGQLNRVYEVLNRKRPLTLKMIWRLHRELGIPADSLIKQDEHRKAA